jgi:hypothetical protein
MTGRYSLSTMDNWSIVVRSDRNQLRAPGCLDILMGGCSGKLELVHMWHGTMAGWMLFSLRKNWPTCSRKVGRAAVRCGEVDGMSNRHQGQCNLTTNPNEFIA